jgi:hypothetical protein
MLVLKFISMPAKGSVVCKSIMPVNKGNYMASAAISSLRNAFSNFLSLL